ncbi:MAG: hypothetical protein PHW76_09935 [Alphaproteobacteria bacterium]|nr:hypothetical protein [Alphaproteobacteria bacterium]
MTTQALCEERMVFLVRNALLVAHQEMGGGDQWPVVKDTIYKIMKDWEDLKTERNIDAELKIHLYAQIQKMEEGLDECSPETRELIEPKIKEWREICDAYFCDVDRNAVMYNEASVPMHIKRMNAMLSTMEEEDAVDA